MPRTGGPVTHNQLLCYVASATRVDTVAGRRKTAYDMRERLPHAMVHSDTSAILHSSAWDKMPVALEC